VFRGIRNGLLSGQSSDFASAFDDAKQISETFDQIVGSGIFQLNSASKPSDVSASTNVSCFSRKDIGPAVSDHQAMLGSGFASTRRFQQGNP
jgi:hypothetical protein